MQVTVQRVDDYNEEKVYEAIRTQFEALEVARGLTPDTSVLLKANLLTARAPETATTTHPAVLGAIARWLREQGVQKIVLADSPGGVYSAAVLRKLYRVCGLSGLEGLVELNEDTSFAQRNGFTLLRPVLDADYIIDCAKLKTHGLTTMTGCVKNLFGCIPGLKKPEMHCLKPTVDGFANYLLDLAQEVKPALCVMDAIDCMEGNGPGGGTVRHMGYLLCSRSPYAIDEQGVRLMGLRPSIAPVIRAACSRGLLDEATQLLGDALVPADPPFTLPDAVLKKERFFTPNGIFHHFFGRRRPLPRVDTAKCIGCGKCAESCPMHLIRVEESKAVMDSKGCISCFCCQEMCPAHAIQVR